ncbi:Protein of unknown function DUF2911 (plasmid) [Gemmatirosa kalamazoonensis]|uniref:DUF2911 domain-containing protein n=1 Tax=Gemmatirosa kalamazoonensis TaxID=861299 RepID=W0RST6_9BACT|nr:DUF2911 domain-containing protein [Gemmatirosa kalamazoonensis]AHG93736.1 Protein of unknown function DUF2911 [Gemmatirosa kalamazoonensis]
MRLRLLCPALLAAAACAGAQPSIPRSQLGTVTQWIAGARLDVVYRRPVARGRELFGALVRWGDLWTPSADSAARLTVSAPIEVNGSRLAAGEYGVWMIPDSASWTWVFTTVAAAHHLRYPPGHDALRVRAAPARGDHYETLAFVLPMVDADSAVLQMRWGSTVVPLSIRVRR